MRSSQDLAGSDVPYFPFDVLPEDGDGHFVTHGHRLDRPVRLNRQAAEILRLADATASLDDIVARLVQRYPAAGGDAAVRPRVLELLDYLTERELIWWRTTPLVASAVGPPASIFWEITAACNLRCRHCVVGAGQPLADEVPTSRWLELAHEMADFGVTVAAFSGGEPLLHPDFRLIAESARRLGMGIQLATNGTLVTPEIAAWLRDLDADIQVSLDGPTPEIHDYLRPGHAAFERAVAGIRALVAAGHQLTIGTLLARHNLALIPRMIELTQELGAARFRLIPFVPHGRGQSHQALEVSPAEARQVAQYVHDLRGHVSVEIVEVEFENTLDGGPCSEPLNLGQSLGCSGAVAYGTITPTGELLPCHFFAGVRADSVAQAGFAEVWRRSRFLNYFRQLTVADLHGACRRCAWLPACRGSCRAVNFAKGDLLGAHRGCWIAQEMEGQPWEPNPS